MKRILAFILITCMVYCAGKLYPHFMDLQHAYEIKEVEEEMVKNPFDAWLKLNPDFVGYLTFDSGILQEPIVKGEQYLRKDFMGNDSSQGTVFMTDAQTFEDQNVVLYGHRVFYDAHAKFSPLVKMLEQSFYEENSTFQVMLEDETRTYGIIGAYVCDLNTDDYVYDDVILSDWFEEWKSALQKRSRIVSLYPYNAESTYITFQTCGSDEDSRVVVVAVRLN